MTWNHRVIKTNGNYQVHEVYYKKGKIDMWTGPVEPFGKTLEELKEEIAMFARACEQLVLEDVNGKLR